MLNIDEFESQFKRAAKTRYVYAPQSFAKVLFVTDLDAAATEALLTQARVLLRPMEGEATEWKQVPGDAYGSTRELKELVDAERADLVVTFRCLKEADKQPVYSLGTYLDVLTQVTEVPVLVLPDPEGDGFGDAKEVREVMVVTDHLSGDSRLVNYGLAFVPEGGKLFLTHIEDDLVFERYIETISKVPGVDTETARAGIHAQLLKEPREFAESCKRVLEEQGQTEVELHPIVRLGHRVRDYTRLVPEHEIDLLVFNAKDEQQAAMRGIAYALAVELKRTPVLLV